MRKIPQNLYSRQRGVAMFVAVALLALAGLGVALSNGLQTVITNQEAQLAATASPGADLSPGDGNKEKTGIEKECPIGTIQRVDSIAETGDEDFSLAVTEDATNEKSQCLVEWCNEEGTMCYIMTAPEAAQIKSSCGKDSGGTCAEKIRQTFKGKIGDKDASAFGENIKKVLTKYDDAFTSTLTDSYADKIESVEETKAHIESLQSRLYELSQNSTDTTVCGSASSECENIKAEISRLQEGIKADEKQLFALTQEAKNLQPFDKKDSPVLGEGSNANPLKGDYYSPRTHEATFVQPEEYTDAPAKATLSGLAKIRQDALTAYQNLQAAENKQKGFFCGFTGWGCSEKDKDLATMTENARQAYLSADAQLKRAEKSLAGTIGDVDEGKTSITLGSKLAADSTTGAVPGREDRKIGDLDLGDIDSYERGELGVGEQVPSAKPPAVAQCDPADVDCASTPKVDYPINEVNNNNNNNNQNNDDFRGPGDQGLLEQLKGLGDLGGLLSKLLGGLGGGGKKGGGGGGMPQPQQQPKSAEEKQNDICKEKYPGTSVKDGRCTCPSGQFFTEGKCQAQKPKEPSDSKTSELMAELSCAPKEQGIGAPILISFACRGPEGMTLRADGFDAKEQLTGSAEIKADIEKVDPLTKMQKFALTCIKDGKTESKSCEVRVVKAALVLVANPSSVNKGEQGKVGWITAGARNCTVSASQGNSDEVDAFNNAHQNVTQVNGTADTPPLSEDMEIVVKCKMHSGEDKEERVTVKVRS
jgi:hypothetical protein